MRQRPTPARLKKLQAIGFDWDGEVGNRKKFLLKGN
jgi:hypothetical protein